ncbi:Uncharacterised protein [Chryseobacterium nakagawai]|uniref:RES domain-containing protein n=1 Tax=Chryseobacterium nakagawai TaxID=1241982 RepID=A0AAD0YQQ9_CHRNA|nr:hypothetical protein [Chryseobacterium nakagawai]AZA92378.1 hypothetical protein EG343_18030 [Chryseobacterium nakagawai]VEH18941.1 Uncharacterised protein [Chryseobacterium nakagawai]
MDFKKLPAIEEIRNIIEELKSYDLTKISDDELFNKLRALSFIPFPTAILKNNFYVDRLRINQENKLFYSIDDISYRKDTENIRSYGRANYPNQSMFYGAFESENIKLPRFVSLIETSEIFRDIEKNNDLDKKFFATLGRWKLKKETEVLEIIFSEDYLKSGENKKAFNYHWSNLKNQLPDYEERFKLILEFFTSEFAKKLINDHRFYKISSSYFNLSLSSSPNIGGVKYPSVKSDYMGYNLALLPEFLDENFELANVSLLEIDKRGKHTTVEIVNNVIDFGENFRNFTWENKEFG